VFEWFIFKVSNTQPATPTGGSWDFNTETGTPPTGWTAIPPASPTTLVWLSVAIVTSTASSTITWSVPGQVAFSGPTSPITSTGDLIVGNGVNSATRLPIGSNGYVLTSNGTTATWLASTGSGANVLGTSPTITTPTINSLSSASATALTLQSAGTTAVTIDTSQNVGIGAASPTTQLSISKGSQGNNLNVRSRAYLGGTTSSDSLVLGYSVKADTGATDQMVGTETNSGAGAPAAILMNSGVMQFHTASSVTSGSAFSSERMRIDSSGNLLVGTTSATGSSRFVVAADTTSTNVMTVSNTRSTAATDYSILFYRNGSIVGSVQTTLSATSFVTSSDYRLKEDIQPMTGALAKVAQLNPVTYKWKLDGTEAQGFIAHELQAVVPDCVTGTKDEVETYTDEDGNEQTRPKYQGIDTSFLVATLTAAIQEQQATITALTARITALENA